MRERGMSDIGLASLTFLHKLHESILTFRHWLYESQRYFWAKEKREGSAELDFALVDNGQIVGIEVKAGESHNLRSLSIFKNEVENSRVIRLYSGNIERTEFYHSLPLYLVTRVMET